MTRTLGGLATMVASSAKTLATCLRLDLTDGTALGFTDHDRDLTHALVVGSLLYSAEQGVLPSNIALAVGLESDNVEAQLPIRTTGDVTLARILGGRFNRARARLFRVNWDDPTDGYIPILAGNVGEVRVNGGACILQIRSDVDRLNQTIGRTITPYCNADFGDARCTLTPDTVVGTVTAVTSALQFTVSFAGAFVDDYFNKGTVTGLTGANAGTQPVEIEDWTSAGAITLFAALAADPGIGDTFTITQGCYDPATHNSKTRLACLHFDNVINFRGFPEVPGSDQALRVPVPGE